MKITSVKLKIRKKYNPYVIILFTPVEVYSHKYGYQKLRNAVHKYAAKFRSIILDIDVLRKSGKGFKDKGMVINFKIGNDSKVKQAFSKFKKLKGKSFFDKRDSYL